MAGQNSGMQVALIGIPEIAAIADVGPSAVGNWRKRHDDFPKPRVQTPSGALFDLDEVEKWLIENGKITKRVPAFVRLRALTDGARGTWQADQISHFCVACLVYFEACERAQALGTRGAQQVPVVPQQASWGHVRQESRPTEFIHSLLAAAREIEGLNPDLEGLIIPGFSHVRETDGATARSIALALDDATDDVTPRFALLDDFAPQHGSVTETARGRLLRNALADLTEADRFSAERSTPEDISYLLVQLVGAATGTIFDPAAGECGLLLLAALWRSSDDHPPAIGGVEINEDVWRIARSRCYLYEIPANITLGNALTMDLSQFPKADSVVLDPPYAMKNWGDADLYLNHRWSFGPPPPKSADFAWLQIAVQQLKPNGRAVVVLPAGTLSRIGQEAEIRHAMIQAGVVEGIVLLPPRMRANTSIPLAIWLLKSPDSDECCDEILLVDASDLAKPGRSRFSLEEETIDRLGELVEAWRLRHEIDSDNTGIAVAVPAGAVTNAVLDPKRYQEMPPLDLAALEFKVQKSRAKAAESAVRARAALAQLTEYLGGDG